MVKDFTLTENQLRNLLESAFKYGVAKGVNETLIIRGYDVEARESMDATINKLISIA